MKFNKPALPIPAQVAKLKSRGLAIPDPALAAHYLSFLGYYHLSAYTYPFQRKDVPDKAFKPGTCFDDVMDIYRFDRELRLLAMDAIERIELAVRTTIVNEGSIRHGPHWFMDPHHFKTGGTRFKHHELLDRIDRELEIPASAKQPKRLHHEDFINHYYSKYTDPYLPPAWMVAETLSLGAWSQIFSNLADSRLRKAIAKPFQVDEHVLQNWLHALTHVRNLCAHHARLWNRRFVIKLTIANKHAAHLKTSDRFYAAAVVMHDLLSIIAPGTTWAMKLHALFQHYRRVDLAAMGFPANWFETPLWQRHSSPDYEI